MSGHDSDSDAPEELTAQEVSQSFELSSELSLNRIRSYSRVPKLGFFYAFGEEFHLFYYLIGIFAVEFISVDTVLVGYQTR